MIRLLAIRVVDRIKEAGHTQEVLTAHSDNILSRLGFHELNEAVCSREGYIILQLRDDDEAYKKLMDDLDGIYGIEIKETVLDGGKKSNKPVMVPEDAGVVLATVKIHDRHEVVARFQKVLSLYGCTVRTRLGINLGASGEGLVLLELTGNADEINGLIERLAALEECSTGLIYFN